MEKTLNPKFILMAGIIAAGKTTASRQLGNHLGYRVIEEPVDDNPYLGNFYQEPKRWAFPMQIELLSQRLEKHKEAISALRSGRDDGVICDRSIYEDSLFCALGRDLGYMSDMEFATYERLFYNLAGELAEPDAFFFLDVSPAVAKSRADNRNRAQEQSALDGKKSGIPLDYLIRLHTKYQEWADAMRKRCLVITIPWDDQKTDAERLNALLEAYNEASHVPQSPLRWSRRLLYRR